MQETIETQSYHKRPSQQMRAVLCLLKADPTLFQRVRPFIDFDRESIYWDQISKISFGSGHRGAIALAYGIWTDEQKSRANVFDGALSMDSRLQAAALRALAIRWGLDSGLDDLSENPYHEGGKI
jgi:hypothetical protein